MVTAEEVRSLFPGMVTRLIPGKADGIDATILFDLSGDNGGQFWIKLADGAAESGEGEIKQPAMTLKASADDWFAVSTGQMNPMQAFMTGKIKILGDMSLAMKMQTMFEFEQ